ncbi:MAG: hypothetical protein PHC66_04325 [Candidatus Nanoarchaeia archaeon]|nr:hypothetical protein [Candidatus Nanoarchaeia archaeon]MDD5239371.1 hypothetical protein [Candidatus Nanoarchaeia archaeon]
MGKLLILVLAIIIFLLGVAFTGSILCAASYVGWMLFGYMILSILFGMLGKG